MTVFDLINMLGGMGLFLFGMSVMGDCLKKVAGSRLEMILYRLSGNPLKGILLGTGVTALIQSSSATSVMAVGFVNSGMMTVRQAIGIVLGAVLGTSVTGWILCLNSLGSGAAGIFSTSTLTGLVSLTGIILWMFSKSRTRKNIGGVLLGFAVLMFGMSTMSGSVTSLRDDPAFISLLTRFSSPVLGILAGLLITAVLQSASASIGILQALAVTGQLSFATALPIIMGVAIGASVPVLLSAMSAGVNAKRTAMAYLAVDVLGAAVCGIVFYALNAFLRFPFMDAPVGMVAVALTNTLFRLATVVFLTPFTGLLEKLVCRIFPDDADTLKEKQDMDRLEPGFLDHPALALEQSAEVLASMAARALEGVESAVRARREGDREAAKRAVGLEEVLDRYEDRVGSYLTKLLTADLTAELSEKLTADLNALSGLESISDRAEAVAGKAEAMIEAGAVFSEGAAADMTLAEDAALEIVSLAVRAFAEKDTDAARRTVPLRETMEKMCAAMRGRHIERIGRGESSYENGFYFSDMLAEYERIASHCTLVASAALPKEESGHASRQLEREGENYPVYIKEYEERFLSALGPA